MPPSLFQHRRWHTVNLSLASNKSADNKEIIGTSIVSFPKT